MKHEKRNKLTIVYELEFYIVSKISGLSVGAYRKSDG